MTPASGIVGHKKQLHALLQDLEQGNLSHAYLFVGPPNVGKTAVAHWFARQILTRDVAADESGELLRQMDRFIHPDFLVLDQLWIEDRCEDWDVIARSSNVAQQHRAKAGLKTDVIAIDDVRVIQARLVETGTLPHRVCIIRGIERMQPAAANAFLKTLEEPLAGRIFLLTTEAPSLLLPTVLSRARIVRFDRVPDRDLQALLAGCPEEDASFIAHVAQGAPGVALRLRDDPDQLRGERLGHTQGAAFWNASSLLERLKLLAPLTNRGPEADRFLFHLSLALREIPGYRRSQERALTQLVQDLRTNAWRPLLLARFAINVG